MITIHWLISILGFIFIAQPSCLCRSKLLRFIYLSNLTSLYIILFYTVNLLNTAWFQPYHLRFRAGVLNPCGTRDQFHGRQFFHRWGGVVSGWFKHFTLSVYLFLPLLHQLHLRSSDPETWGSLVQRESMHKRDLRLNNLCLCFDGALQPSVI